MNITSLIALTENDKRIIIALVIVFILVFVLLGVIGMLVTKLMKWQGKAADNMMHDIVVTKVISDRKHFKKVARKKNWRYLYKQARIPLIIMIVSVVVLLIYYCVTGWWNANIFGDYTIGGKGFATLLFLWDWAACPTVNFFGLQIISGWPPLLNTPHFEVNAWGSYVFVPLIITGGCWFLVNIQCFIARSFRIRKLASSIYGKDLSNYNQDQSIGIAPQTNNQNTNTPQ